MSKKVCLKSKNANGHVLPWVRVGLGLGRGGGEARGGRRGGGG